MMNEKKDYHVILIDGSSYIYRAYYALPPMTSASGKPTSVVFGVVNMVRKLIKTHPNSQIAVVFDAPGKNFRHELYPEYKANRPKMPDEIRLQIEPLHNIIKAMGLNLLMVEGVEADDVLGTLATHYAKKQKKVLISSGDKDLAQLVDEHISVVDTMKNVTFDAAEVVKKFGVNPSQIIDYLALVGDSSDNIPGIPSVGPKTAQKWLSEYQSISGIIEKKEEFKGKVGDLLRANLDQLKVSHALATIKRDIPLAKLEVYLNETGELKINPLDEEALIQHYQEMSFNSWIVEDTQGLTRSLDQHYIEQNNQQEQQNAKKIESQSFNKIIDSVDKFEESAMKMHKNSKTWCIYWLTNEHNIEIKIDKFPNQAAEITLIAIAISNGVESLCYCLKNQDEMDAVLKAIAPALMDEKLVKVSMQGKFDLHLMNHHHLKINNLIDVSVLAWMIDSNGKHDLKTLVQKYLQTILAQIWQEDEKKHDLTTLKSETIQTFLLDCAKRTIELHQHLSQKISQIDKLEKLFKLESRVLYALAHMEQTGILLDKKALFDQGKLLKAEIKNLEKKAHLIADETFNLASSLQVAAILYDKLKLPTIAKTPAGKPSTAEATLERLSDHHPICEVILNHRMLSKLVSTYIDALPKKINPRTSRIHTTFNQTGTITGRLSSTEPNLQNIPIRTEEGKKIRRAFIAKENSVLICADYSQIELRLMADFSEDQGFTKAFNQGLDIHQATASEVFNLPLSEVDSDSRRKAKAVNFGLIYGISSFGLARQLKVDPAQAKSYIDAYFSRYPKVLAFMEEQKIKAKEQGFVESVMGRRIHLPDIHAKNFARRAHAERMAINAPLQSSASDIIKKAMVEIEAWLGQSDELTGAIKMVLQIHDELVFEVQVGYEELAKKKITELMENTFKLKVPLLVNVSQATNLGMIA